jgi:hypothetical protein
MITGSNIAVMWSRKMGDTPEPLFVDDNALTEDERITLVDTAPGQYDLHIANVEAYDSGEYMCHMTTTPELSQTHQLIVKGQLQVSSAVGCVFVGNRVGHEIVCRRYTRLYIVCPPKVGQRIRADA